jgi:hypothetical protein
VSLVLLVGCCVVLNADTSVRDVSLPQAAQTALGAATSAPVPSADDINNGDDQMDVDFSKANGS